MFPLELDLVILRRVNMREQQFQQFVRLITVQTVDPCDKAGVQIQHFVPGHGVGGHQRMETLDRTFSRFSTPEIDNRSI